MRTALILCLAAVILTAGCLGLPSAEEENPENETDTEQVSKDVVKRFALDESSVFQGSSTYLTLRLQNARDRPLHEVHADIGNYGKLYITREVPSQQESNAPPTECFYDAIPANSDESTAEYRCIWRVEAGGDMLGQVRDRVQLPLTTFVTYSSALTTDRSIHATFEPEQNIRPGDPQQSVVQASNTDVTVTVRHSSPVPAETGEVPITVEVRNVGSGDIYTDDEDARRSVTVSFDGTLAEAAWDMQDTTCVDGPDTKQKTVYFSGDTQSTSFSCVIALQDSDLAGKTFFVRPTVAYRYRLITEAPLTVMRRN